MIRPERLLFVLLLALAPVAVLAAKGTVVVPGTLPGRALPGGAPGPGLYCAVIVKRVDARTRAKTSINELLRD